MCGGHAGKRKAWWRAKRQKLNGRKKRKGFDVTDLVRTHVALGAGVLVSKNNVRSKKKSTRRVGTSLFAGEVESS